MQRAWVFCTVVVHQRFVFETAPSMQRVRLLSFKRALLLRAVPAKLLLRRVCREMLANSKVFAHGRLTANGFSDSTSPGRRNETNRCK